VRAALLAALVLAVGAAPAAAEPVLDLGQGEQPSAVTDAAGTLHVVWRDPATANVPLMYCRVPAGGTGCAPIPLVLGAQWAPRLLLRPQDGALVVVYPGLDDGSALRTMMTASLDGGATWSPRRPVGTGLSVLDGAALTPDGAFVDTVGATPTGDVLFQRVSLAGGTEARVVVLASRQGLARSRVTHLGDGSVVVTAHDGAGRLVTRVAAAGADPDDPAAWGLSTAFRRLRDADAADADAGPTGTWLLATDLVRTRPGSRPVRIWRWRSRGFEGPRTVGALARGAASEIGQAQDTNVVSLDVDLAGRLHAVWPLPRANCGGRLCLVYRRTDRNGFMAPVVLPVASPTETVEHFQPAANSGGSGWLVLDTTTSRIRAVPLVTPPRGARVGSRRLGRLRVSVPDYFGCVPSGGTFTHRLRVDGRRGTRIVSVRFFFDAGVPARTDHRAPWAVRFRLGFAPATRHVAGALVRYRLPGRSQVRTARLGRTFVMC
jgi:hypothetical protein